MCERLEDQSKLFKITVYIFRNDNEVVKINKSTFIYGTSKEGVDNLQEVEGNITQTHGEAKPFIMTIRCRKACNFPKIFIHGNLPEIWKEVKTGKNVVVFAERL